MSIDTNKLRATPKQVSSIGGTVATPNTGLEGLSVKCAAASGSPDVNKLRATSKQVSSIGGTVRTCGH